MGRFEPEAKHGLNKLPPIPPICDSRLHLDVAHTTLGVYREPHDEGLPLNRAGTWKGGEKRVPHCGREDGAVTPGARSGAAAYSRNLPKNIRPIQLARTVGAGAGIGGGRGAETGSGGGIGSGEGTGIGSEVGPGSGGDGAVFPPTVRYTFLPPLPRPSSVQGQTFLVRFAVDAQGRVADVEVEPRIPDGGYRKKFVDTMLRFRFKPAHLRDGTNVAGATVLSFTL